VTGGEPLAQDVGPLLRALGAAGFKVQVETNGTFPPVAGADWLTASPKPPDYDAHPGIIKEAREVKLVACRSLTLDAVRAVRAAFPRRTPLLIQPQSNAAWSRERALGLLRGAARSGLEGVRLAVQLHRIYKVR